MSNDELAKYVSDSFEAAKKGAALERYDAILPHAAEGTLPQKSHYAFGWICYYALHQSPDNDISGRKRILATYLGLQVTKPHKLHSMILTEAIRLYKNASDVHSASQQGGAVPFSIVRFMQLWDISNLRPGDWRRKELEGKPLTSTAEKLITVCTDEFARLSTAATPEFTALADKALSEFPDTPALLAQRATLHELAGEPDAAKKALRQALLNAPGKFHLWSRLAALIPPHENIHLHIALLYKSLKAPGQPGFKGRVRISLAEAWLFRGMQAQAMWELARVRTLYETSGWHLPKTYAEAMRRISSGAGSGAEAADPEPLYRKVEHLADDEIYAGLPDIEVIKSYHKNPAPDTGRRHGGRPATAWRVTAPDGSCYWLQPHRYGIPADLPIGTPLRIKIHNGKPVKAILVRNEGSRQDESRQSEKV